MWTWLLENLATILISAVLLAVIAAIIVHLARNRRAGILIGEGVGVQDAMRQVGAVVEGYYAARSAWELAQKHKVNMPITEAAYNVLYCGADAREAIHHLMARQKTCETENAEWAR